MPASLAHVHLANDVSQLYERIGDFLRRNRLDPDPVNYTFAYGLLTEGDARLLRDIQRLNDDGIRLSRREIEALGGAASIDPRARAVTSDAAPAPDDAPSERETHEGLVARTQMQVDGFADLMRAMQAETQGFGRDLAASADRIARVAPKGKAGEVVDLTSAMLDRVRRAETRLEAATREASDLREQLDVARDNARRDPLTGLPNRRGLEEAVRAASEAGAAMAIAICDVDRFKSVNDSFGHAIGDRVLKAIGAVLAQSCPEALVARYGGEEFALLFTGPVVRQARDLLEDARETVGAKRYRLRETDVPLGAVTFSGGLVVVRAGEDFAEALARADMLLYAAKDGGRNRIESDLA